MNIRDYVEKPDSNICPWIGGLISNLLHNDSEQIIGQTLDGRKLDVLEYIEEDMETMKEDDFWYVIWKEWWIGWILNCGYI